MGDDLEAIECYTLSLAYANNDELMAYAHANRSAALYRKQLYKECLIDIDAALHHGYPKEKQKNLKERGDKAIIEIKKLLQIDSQDNQKDVTKACNKCMEKSDITKPIENAEYIENETIKKDHWINVSKKQNAMTNENYLYFTTRIFPQKPRYLQNDDFSKLMYGPSQEVPAISDGVVISFSERYGRHYVATREFQPGDIVSIEDPYAHVIYEERCEINLYSTSFFLLRILYTYFNIPSKCTCIFISSFLVTDIIHIATIVYPEATI